jgi:hypothetical protein
MDYDKKLDEIIPSGFMSSIVEIQQPRSNYQIYNFVVNQHDTEQQRYLQCLREIQSLYYTIKRVSLDMQKTEIKIKRLRETEDEIDKLDADILELGLEETRVVGLGSFRELEFLLNLYNSFEKKYTRQEVEDSEPEYWQKRLNRQAEMDSASARLGISAGNLEALRQIGLLGRQIEEKTS